MGSPPFGTGVIFESFQSAGTCPSHSDLLNSLVREGAMAVAVFRSMTLEILSGPDDVSGTGGQQVKNFILRTGDV